MSEINEPTIRYRRGSYFVPAGRKPWPHEIKSAEALADAGYKVEFLAEDPKDGGADAKLDGIIFEFKSPKSSNMKGMERNLKKASSQSANVLIDSRRIKNVQDRTIMKFLKDKLKTQRTIKRILFINKSGKIVDINELI